MGLQGIMGKRVNAQFATTSASPLSHFLGMGVLTTDNRFTSCANHGLV